jgi:hypothetical protein
MSDGFLIQKADKVVLWRKDEQDWNKTKFPETTYEFRLDDDADPLVPELRNQQNLDPDEFKWNPVQKKMVAKRQAEKDAESDARADDIFDKAKSDLMLLVRAMVIELAAELPGLTAQQLSDRIKRRFRQIRRTL